MNAPESATLEKLNPPPGADARPFYKPVPGVYDEMQSADGKIADPWQPIANWFNAAGDSSQTDRARQVDQLVFEHFFDPHRDRHAWHLDLCPLILDSATWSKIEKAALQRAHLYNALLADLYGGQTVFKQRYLPPSLVFNDPSFLRAVHGIAPSGGHLTFLALDFARDPAGNWRIIDTHTETPAGHGFALANRMVVSEVFSQLFRQAEAMRIGPFYQRLNEDLIARAGVDDPLIAILAPMPGQSAFVGHSYMARHLGYLRVQGSDLRVIGDRVYLKTIDGLKKVDLIVRAIEGHLADPLELSPGGFDGPVGLVQACRHSPDIMVNALGTAAVENRALSGYLNGLSHRFLGEELSIFDTPRLWLGDPIAQSEVIADLDSYVIHSAQEGTGSPGEAAQGRSSRSMTAAERSDLISEIRFRGPLLVAERETGFSTAPSWTPEGLKPERYAVRVYVSAIGGTFQVMPGGLALSVDQGSTVALSSSQGRSRDVWVANKESHLKGKSLRRMTAQHARIQRIPQPLQSRSADNLFWLGRYCERADGTLRIIRQTLLRSSADLLALSNFQQPARALRAILDSDMPPDESLIEAEKSEVEALYDAISDLCRSSEHLQALPRTFENIRGAALQCRERLSQDSWRILTGLNANSLAARLNADDATPRETADSLAANAVDLIDECEKLLDGLSAFAGMTHENMTRNDGWRFMDLGRRMERAHQLATVLKSLFVAPAGKPNSDREHDGDDLVFALQAADSFITFRSRYRYAPEMHLVLDLLVIDETNPRSLAYQLSAINDHITHLPKAAGDAVRSPDQRLALELMTRVRLADVDELAGRDASQRPKINPLGAFLDHLIDDLPRLSELLSRSYVSLTDEQPHQLNTLL